MLVHLVRDTRTNGEKREVNATRRKGWDIDGWEDRMGNKGCRMCTFEEDVAGFGVGGDALEEGEGVADAV